MLEMLKSFFRAPTPAGPARTLHLFSDGDPVITQDGVSIDEGAWRIESAGTRTVRLFELPVPQPGVEQCMVTYRSQIKTSDVQGKAYLEMWCRFPGRGEFFSRGLNQVASGTTGWASYETPFYLKRGQAPDLLKLNVVIEGPGTVWMRDVEVLVTPLK
jgi:hypothetical protein